MVGSDLRERTFNFARNVIRFYTSLPKDSVAQLIGKQLLRSGTSIGANYREAYRARSRAEFISKIGECLRETDETLYWLELLKAEAIGNPSTIAEGVKEADELIAIFTTIAKSAKRTDAQ